MLQCDSVVAGVSSAMSIQDELICVCLVMPHCMFGMQLFLSEIVKFRFDQSELHKPLVQRSFYTQQPNWVFFSATY